jgi:hypothetical protein
MSLIIAANIVLSVIVVTVIVGFLSRAIQTSRPHRDS